jgi:pyrimidine deaminase RibD-like protein
VGEAGGGQEQEDAADEDPVVAAVVVTAEEQADRVAGEEHRQGKCHASESALNDRAHHVADRAGDVPPFEGGDDDRESDEEERCAVPLRR